jgi:hypothetical protein
MNSVPPRIILQGNAQEAAQWTGAAKNLARQSYGAGIRQKTMALDKNTNIQIRNAPGARISKAIITSRAGGIPEKSIDRIDVIVLLDLTGSYSRQIPALRAKVNELAAAIEGSVTDMQVGLASFADYPMSPYGGSDDYPYKLDQKLTKDVEKISSAADGLARGLWGGDGPESQLKALYELAIGGATVGWRENAFHVVLLSTDIDFHNPEPGTAEYTPNYPGPGWSVVLKALKRADVNVFGLVPDDWPIRDLNQITEETNGEIYLLNIPATTIVSNMVQRLSELL